MTAPAQDWPLVGRGEEVRALLAALHDRGAGLLGAAAAADRAQKLAERCELARTRALLEATSTSTPSERQREIALVVPG